MRACLPLFLLSMILSVACSIPVTAQEKTMSPVTQHASPEARALLKFFYSISGEYLLTGQHNFPNVKGRNSRFSADYTGKNGKFTQLIHKR